MKRNQESWPEESELRENVEATLVVWIWELTEKIHYRKNSWGKDKITRDALQWISDGLWHLTCPELALLYSLLSPTQRTSPISESDTRITALLSKLSDVNSEKLSGTSASQNFRSVEQFISTLCSGGYPLMYFHKNGKLVRLPDYGEEDSYISN